MGILPMRVTAEVLEPMYAGVNFIECGGAGGNQKGKLQGRSAFQQGLIDNIGGGDFDGGKVQAGRGVDVGEGEWGGDGEEAAMTDSGGDLAKLKGGQFVATEHFGGVGV